jgi:hypothetical protein
MVYMVDDNEHSTPPVQRPPRKAFRKGSAKMAKPDQPLTKAVKPAPVPIAKSEAPDAVKATLLDRLDDDSPLASLIKTLGPDPVARRIVRRQWDEPTAIEKSVDAMQADIGKVLGVIEAQSHLRHKTNGARVAPLQPSSPAAAPSARHYDYDEPESPQTRELFKAVAADPRRDARVSAIKRLLGVTEEMERAREAALTTKIAEVRANVNRALLLGRTATQPAHQDNQQSAN